MVNFRPHILKALISKSDDIVDPVTGVIIKGDVEEIVFKCRATPNGKGEVTRTQDGNSVVYAYLIHADKENDPIPYGIQVDIFDHQDNLIAQGKVIRSWNNQKNLRIWL